MRNYIQRLMKNSQRLLTFLIEDVRLFVYFVLYVSVLLGFGWIYSLLTPYGHGLARNGQALADATFLDGVYFSVVTISSLGYGDLQPIGFSRALACFQVLFGLSWMGIIVAKLTSRRLSHHVQRLFSSDAQKRLEEFTVQFATSAQQISDAMRSLGNAYQSTPGSNVKDDKVAARKTFTLALIELHAKSAGLWEYLSLESEHGGYFTIAPVDALRRLGDNTQKGLFVLGQLIISLPPDARTEVLDGQNRQRISETLGSQKTICQLVNNSCKDQDTLKLFNLVLETCNGVPESYFTMPVAAAKAEQPNQILVGTDDPQDTVGH